MSTSRDQLLEYALGLLEPAEKAVLDRVIAGDPALQQELAAVEESLGSIPLGLAPISPAPATRLRLLASLTRDRFAPFLGRFAQLADLAEAKARELLDRIDDATAWAAEGLEGFAFMHFAGGPRVAGADAGFVKAVPGFEFPRHRHLGEEHVLVLEGAFLDTSDGTIARVGDLVVKPAGSVHGYVVQPGADLLYAIVSYDGFEVVPPES
jgi:hypothetical protein